MSDEQDKLKVSLEPPKLFGRKKKADGPAKAPAAKARPAEPASADADEPVEETAALEETGDDTAPVDDTVEETAPVDESVEAPAAVDEPAAESSGDTAVIEVPETAAEASPAPAPKKAPPRPAEKKPAAKAAAPAKKTTTAKPAPQPTPAGEAETEPTAPAAAVAKKITRPRAKLAPPIEPEPVKDTDLEDAAITAQDDDNGPLLDMYPAAAVTGVVVGAVMVLLTWLSLRGCEAVRGTSSCGGGPGFLLLVATFVLCILLGSTLLKTFQIPDPGSSSFLAVGLVAVVALLFLIDALDNWSMIIVIPVLSVGAYAASVWVTKTFVEPGGTET